MLFNSYPFLFIFLPCAWLGWWVLNHWHRPRWIIGFLALVSLVFYGAWNPDFLPVLLGSVGVNYLLVHSMAGKQGGVRRIYFFIGLAFNLLLLGYYKYAGFLLAPFNDGLTEVILPLGISFYTFQQVAYLVDSYKGQAHEPDFLTYLLFVTFFPHCIAGPLVHHREMIPQFSRRVTGLSVHVAVGLSLLILGLFKKVVIADPVGLQASVVFSQAAAGHAPGLLEAWGAAICYSFQIYFDFSAYSDMAVGLARLFGITLPVNFASPYKAISFIDFWKRWHISLSRFLRDYIYIPLGGNRHGRGRQLANLLITMLIGGFWHGASWLMIAWGALHGILLVANHLWRWANLPALPAPMARILVFLAVTIAWVLFRAENIDAARQIYSGMVGLNGLIAQPDAGYDGRIMLIAALCLPLFVWFLPNSYEWLRNHRPALPVEGYPATQISYDAAQLAWAARPMHALAMGVLFFTVLLKLTDASEFLYFQF